MWTITLRDLQFRGRQFGIAVAGASLVFALTLILTGISAGFRHEASRTVGLVGADSWIVSRGVTGPFTSQATLPARAAAVIAKEPGVTSAYPLVRGGESATLADGRSHIVNILGHRIGGLGPPGWGVRAAAQRGQVVVDSHVGASAGDTVRIGGRPFRVAEVVHDQTYFAGIPIVWMDLADAQAIEYQGQPLASVIVTRGVPRRLPPGFGMVKPAAVRHDLLEPVKGAASAIDSLRVLMWIVAAVIIGAVVYLSALERVRDFAVLKAVGGSSRDLVVSLATEAVVASILAAAIGGGLALLLKPLFPMPVTIETGAYLLLPVIAVITGTLASLAALRRAVSVDPALAFAG